MIYLNKIFHIKRDNAQPCYCGEPTCTGFIGGNKKSELKEIISEGKFL